VQQHHHHESQEQYQINSPVRGVINSPIKGGGGGLNAIAAGTEAAIYED